MFKTFNLTLPATPGAQTLLQLLVTGGFCDSLGNMLVSSVKNDAIVPLDVQQLTIAVTGGSVIIQDNSGSSASGNTYGTGQANTWRSSVNSIRISDYSLLGAAGNETVTIDMESL